MPPIALLTSQAHLPSPPFTNVHGLTATGKSSVLRAYFHAARLPHAFINVRECITTRHLLERMVAASLDALDEAHDEKIDRRPYARTENLSALCVNLQKMLEGRSKFVLVLDAIDRLREGSGGLVAALGRLGEAVRLADSSHQQSLLTNRLDTRARPRPHNNPPHRALTRPLGRDPLHCLPALHTSTAPRHSLQDTPESLRHTALRRHISRLHARPRRRRRCLALVPLSRRRVRQLE